MWKCSCGAVFRSYLDRDNSLHKGHSWSLVEEETAYVTPSRDVPTTVPEDLTDASLPVTDSWLEDIATDARQKTERSCAMLAGLAKCDCMDELVRETERLGLYSDPVTSPAHYNQGSVECIDAIASMLGPDSFKAYCQGNAMKYLWRHEYKGKSSEDLAKANYYLNRMRGEE